MLLLAALAALAPVLAPHDPLRIDILRRLTPPCPAYPLGTDALGRCLLSRILWGARLTLAMGVAASGLSVCLGVSVGLIAGMSGRIAGQALARVTEIFLAFPGILPAMVVAGLLGPSPESLILGYCSTAWAWWARLAGELTVSAREREFVKAAETLGLGRARLLRRYVLPQIMAPLLVAASLRTGLTILALAGLGFLGVGLGPPSPEWGAMLLDSRVQLVRAPWLFAAPALAITVAVLGFTLLAEGVRERGHVRQMGGW